MKHLIFLTILVCANALASMPPNSGIFSNVKNEIPPYGAFAKLSHIYKVNLIVTESKGKQQFFIQCFVGEEAQPGVITEFNESRQVTNINSGLGCPANVLKIELQYEEAIIHTEEGKIYLPRGPIFVP